METVEIKTVVTKEVHEIGVAVKGVISKFKVAKADGWQPGQDIPTVLMGSLQEFLTAIDGADKVGGEFSEAPIKAAMGALIPISEGVELLMDKSGDTAQA